MGHKIQLKKTLLAGLRLGESGPPLGPTGASLGAGRGNAHHANESTSMLRFGGWGGPVFLDVQN